ncbi:uncharacterized protein LOC128882131 [Hylaeus volcanicus]|uniref:uncharacterized protein LOC128882131 n=1 Tax=Hylaeus volcanicus TaxID=313075 RepID=UPI0023B80E52|nr:uncharacterized protein LOC128882131 [Hylaeus volcanicus]
MTNTPKILGLTFDNKHTWIPFLKNLKTECLRRLNILKVIASKNWGAEFQVLIKSYKALVLSKLDYGSIVYSSAKPSTLKILSPIHNAGARIATGAYCTNPITAILSGANILRCQKTTSTLKKSLEIRRKQLSLSYAASKMSTSSNPVYKQITTDNLSSVFGKKPNLPKPLNFRLRGYLMDLNINTPLVAPRKHYKSPPWTIETPLIIDKFLKVGRDINPNIVKTLYIEITNEYQNHKQVFTDGSKSPQGTGCAVCLPDIDLTFKLPDGFTVFSSEAFAVQEALKYIEKETHNKFIIFSDSKSVILALQNCESSDTIIRNIIELNATLSQNGKEILYSWIPSHVNIEGNEKADIAAKAAVSSTAEISNYSVSYKDLQKFFIKAITDWWNEEWKHSKPTKLHKIRDNINEIHPAWRLNRKDQVKLTRLRIGHTSWSHSYLITKTEPNNCDTCRTQNSIEHILVTCLKYNTIKTQFELPNSLSVLREENSGKQTLSFLKDIGLYHLI